MGLPKATMGLKNLVVCPIGQLSPRRGKIESVAHTELPGSENAHTAALTRGQKAHGNLVFERFKNNPRFLRDLVITIEANPA